MSRFSDRNKGIKKEAVITSGWVPAQSDPDVFAAFSFLMNYNSRIIDGVEVRELPEYPGYWISNDGRVYSRSGRWLTGSDEGTGYLKITMVSNVTRRKHHLRVTVSLLSHGYRTPILKTMSMSITSITLKVITELKI